jgi:ribosome-associated protein YbcJ (S4-like RNA binding protein)
MWIWLLEIQKYQELKVQQWLESGKDIKTWWQENQIAYSTFLNGVVVSNLN